MAPNVDKFLNFGVKNRSKFFSFQKFFSEAFKVFGKKLFGSWSSSADIL